MRSPAPVSILSLAALAAVLGCNITPTSTAIVAPTPGASLHGVLHGGMQPVAGAHVYLLAANTAGYGSASLSLLNAASTGNSDTLGAFVLTDASGAFSLTGDYTCTPGQQVYLYALGGSSGSGANSLAAFLAILGNCPAAGTFAASLPLLQVNEVTTVAAAYALSAFASDATHISSSGAPQSLTGIANAFATAGNLASISTGLALATTPAGNGTVPQATLNTLANILAACNDTNGSPSSNIGGFITLLPCGSLLLAATADASPRGAQASDTATAALNIVHNPTANLDTLFPLVPSAAPFTPTLSTEPSDFSVAIAFTGGGITGTRHIAIDAPGNIWLSDPANPGIDKLSPLGAPLSSSTGFRDTSLTAPGNLAIDLSGNLWVANASSTSGSVAEFDPSGAFLRSAATPHLPFGIAIDPSNRLWVANTDNATGTLAEISSSGVLLNTFSGGLGATPSALVMDASHNLWVDTGSSVARFSSAGTPNPSSPFSAAAIASPQSIAFDSNGNLWALNANASLGALKSSGLPVSAPPLHTGTSLQGLAIAIDGQNQLWTIDSAPGTGSGRTPALLGLTTSGQLLSNPSGFALMGATASDLAIDSSGNLWIPTGAQVLEFIGLAAPVVTPLSAAVASSALATRP